MALEGLDGTFCIADDILIYCKGDTYEEAEKNHGQRFTTFMDRCHQKTIELNPDKLQFKLREIKFMGNVVTDTGIHADPVKVKADDTHSRNWRRNSVPKVGAEFQRRKSTWTTQKLKMMLLRRHV